MGETFLFDKLAALNDVYNNTIYEAKEATQPASIKSALLPHQLALVEGMFKYRDRMTRGFIHNSQAVNGKVGILGDPAGTGKTLSVLSYIAKYSDAFPKITCELTTNSSRYFYSHEMYEIKDASYSNLVIVPHSLFNQWKSECTKHTTLKFVPIETKRLLKVPELPKLITASSFVLTTNKCYKHIQQYADQHNIKWNNVFIDEASSIYINSADPPLRFQFLWFVTNNWIPLIFKTPSFVKSTLYCLKDRVVLHPELENWLLDHKTSHYEGLLTSSAFLKDYLPLYHELKGFTVLRTSINLINSSINIVTPETSVLLCRPNITLHSLMSYYLARNLEPNIVSEKIPNLFQALGISFKKLDDFIDLQPTTKHSLIRRKVDDNECVICLDRTEYPTIVNCCYNVYCAKCILKNTLISQKCATCRDILDVDNLCCLKPLTDSEIMMTRNKADTCIDLIRSNPQGKFIIHSSFENIFYQLFEKIDTLGLKAERLESNLFSLLRTIKNFTEGTTNILFVSNIELIRGISLPTTSHLIFYHEQSVSELKQVLIHSAQRIGRLQPLKIIQLLSEIQV
jgi:hypothetical protein